MMRRMETGFLLRSPTPNVKRLLDVVHGSDPTRKTPTTRANGLLLTLTTQITREHGLLARSLTPTTLRTRHLPTLSQLEL
jgi:hypothetical protein